MLIRRPFDKHRKAIEQRVRKILTAKKRGLNTTALEREVDHLVYEVYRLTSEDVALIEGGDNV